MLSHRFKYQAVRFLIILLFILFFFTLKSPFVSASATQGYWKLVKVERGYEAEYAKKVKQGKIRFQPGIYRPTEMQEGRNEYKSISGNRLVTNYKSQRGKVEGEKRWYDKHGILTDEIAAYVSWAEPPKKMKPGEKWDWKFRAEVTRDYCKRGKRAIVYPKANVYLRCTASDTISGRRKEITVGYPKVGIVKYPPHLHRKNLNQPVFEFPNRSKVNQKYIHISIHTEVPVSLWRDSYTYIYEWFNPTPKQITGNLVLTAKHNYGGKVGKLKVKITNLDTGKTRNLTTDDNGQIKQMFKATTTDDYIRIRTDGCEIGPKTFYTIPMEGKKPSHIRDSKYPIEFDLGRVVKLKDYKKEFSTNETIDITLTEATLMPFKWDQTQKKWVSCPAYVSVKYKEIRTFLIELGDFKKMNDGSYVSKVYFPCSNILKTRRLGLVAFDTKDKLKNLQFFDITPSSRKPVNTVTFNLCDTSMMIAIMKQRLREYFTPIVGDDMAKKLANVKVVLDPSINGANYLDGVIRVNDNLDLTTDQNCDTLSHEWSHYIMEVLASDPGVEDLIGGGHEMWKPANNNETAWDEGRAHFMGTLISKGLGLPNGSDMDIFFKKKIHIDPSKAPKVGDSVEGVITQALVNYYRGSGYTKTQEVFKDFINVQNYGKKTLGHPPRTSSDYFKVKKQYIEQLRQNGKIDAATAAARLNEINKIVKEFHITVK